MCFRDKKMVPPVYRLYGRLDYLHPTAFKCVLLLCTNAASYVPLHSATCSRLLSKKCFRDETLQLFTVS